MSSEWSMLLDEDKIPHIIITENGVERIPTIDEVTRAIIILNEDGSTCVRLSCQNVACKDKGGWIERTRKDASKHVYACDSCGKPMQR